jgi:hypothetical protein
MVEITFYVRHLCIKPLSKAKDIIYSSYLTISVKSGMENQQAKNTNSHREDASPPGGEAPSSQPVPILHDHRPNSAGSG